MDKIFKKIFITLGLAFLLTISIMSLGSAGEAGENIGTYKYNTIVRLPQVCADCSYVKISSIISPNGTIYAEEASMTKNGTFYYYDFSNTLQLGDYKVNGHFDIEGTDEVFYYVFTVTPSGTSGSSNIAFFILVILLIYGIAFVGLFGRNIPVTIMGGMAMIFLGVYLFNNGVMIFRDDLTRYLSYITIGIGSILAIWASYEWYQDL